MISVARSIIRSFRPVDRVSVAPVILSAVLMLVLSGMEVAAVGLCRSDESEDPGPASNSGPTPTITASSVTGMAPFTVHVHALDSHLQSGDELTAWYGWDFGDPDGRYNQLTGFNAAHFYERPGTYTIALTLTDENNLSATSRTTITVRPGTRAPIYVSAEGDDHNNGMSPEAPLRSFRHAMRRLRDNTEILFRRGDTFEVEAPVELNRRNWLIGAYGRGVRPILRWTGDVGSYSAMIGLNPDRTRDAVIQGVRFDSRHEAWAGRNIIDAIQPAGVNISVVDCSFGHVTTALNANRSPEGLFSMANVAPDHNSLRAYYLWGQGSGHTHLGNVINGSALEHNIRLGGVSRVLIAHNQLTNFPKRTIWAMIGDHVWITGNSLSNGRVTLGPDHTKPGASQSLQWCVVEGNHLGFDSADYPALEVEPGSAHVSVRNNIIETAGNTSVAIKGLNSETERVVQDVRVLHNTAVMPGSIGRFLWCEPGMQGLTVAGNLFIAPNLRTGTHRSAVLFLLADDLDGITCFRDNVWPVPAGFDWVDDGYIYLWPEWSDSRGYLGVEQWGALAVTENESFATVELDADYRPVSGSETITTGRAVPGIRIDFHGDVRNPLTVTAGAVELHR